MKQSKKNSYPGIQIGISFLLVVFIVLCLVIFATLSLSGALRDNEYSKKTAKRATDYYEACSQAQDTIGDIDAILGNAEKSTDNYEDYLAYVTLHISESPDFEMDTSSGQSIISFKKNINSTQTLEVALELNDKSQTNDEAYRIIKWKETSSKNWEEKTTLPVLGSDNND